MQASQVETPPGGTNHREAQNTENTGAIVAQLPAISNSQHNSAAAGISANADDYVRELAKGNTAKLLAKAANYASMHAPHTLWQRRMKLGRTTVVVRMQWPGTLCIFDPATGEKLAESLPGQPDKLQKQ
jgi:hypothetical protein